MAHDFTDEELEGLSDAEREAILAEADEDNAQVGDTTPSEVDDDEDAQSAAEAGAAAAEAAPAVQEAEAADEPPEFTPRYVVEAPADADAKLADIDSRKADLRQKLTEGDIGLDEYTAQYDALNGEERTLRDDMLRAKIASEQAEQADRQRWEWEQEQFFNAKENAVYKDKYLLTALDMAIKDLANDPANEGKKGPWFLAEADKMIRERFGMAKTDKTIDPPNPPRDKQRIQPPPTLANMPAAELSETGGGDEFAHLDKLPPFELEKALARMTEDQQNRYLGVYG